MSHLPLLKNSKELVNEWNFSMISSLHALQQSLSDNNAELYLGERAEK